METRRKRPRARARATERCEREGEGNVIWNDARECECEMECECEWECDGVEREVRERSLRSSMAVFASDDATRRVLRENAPEEDGMLKWFRDATATATWGEAEVDFMRASASASAGKAMTYDGRPGRGARERMSLRAYVRANGRGRDGGILYGAQIALSELDGGDAAGTTLSEWTAETFRRLFRRKGVSARETNLWVIGDGEGHTNWHYDNYDNVLTVLTGSKIVYLRAPAYYERARERWPSRDRLFAAGTESSNHAIDGESIISGFDYKVCLSHGDSLFIPTGWLHAVWSSPWTIAVNRWWTNGFNRAMSHSVLDIHDSGEKDEYLRSLPENELGFVGRHNTYYLRRALEFALDGYIKSHAIECKSADDEDFAGDVGLNDAPRNFVAMLQVARAHANENPPNYLAAHKVDMFWRALENFTDSAPDQREREAWWNEFYSKCTTDWMTEWATWLSAGEGEQRRRFARSYDLKTPADVIAAVLRNQRFAIAHRARDLMLDALDDGFSVEIKVRDVEDRIS